MTAVTPDVSLLQSVNLAASNLRTLEVKQTITMLAGSDREYPGLEGEAIGRCYSYHANRERDEYMVSYDDLKEFDLESLAETTSGSIPAEDWMVMEIPDHQNQSKDITIADSRLLEDEEKASLLHDVLLAMYLHRE